MPRKFSMVGSGRPSNGDQKLTLQLTLPDAFGLLYSLLHTIQVESKVLTDRPVDEPAVAIEFYGTLKENRDVPVGSLTETP